MLRTIARSSIAMGPSEGAGSMPRATGQDLVPCHVQQHRCLALHLLLRLGEYWFRISRYVYECNRPRGPILRQSRCNLMYDFYLTCIDGDEQVLHIQRDQNTWNTIQDQNWIFFFWTMSNEQWKAKNRMKTKVEQNLNEDRTTTK
jgi:hypothetical protein